MSVAEEVYTKHVQPLSVPERRQLMSLLEKNLQRAQNTRPHSIGELRGLGKEIWKDVDADEYIRLLRDTWNRNP